MRKEAVIALGISLLLLLIVLFFVSPSLRSYKECTAADDYGDCIKQEAIAKDCSDMYPPGSEEWFKCVPPVEEDADQVPEPL